MTTSRGLIGFFALCLVSATSAQENQDFDVVTMNNGDIFNGNLVLEQFDIDTGYGTVAVSADYVTDVEIDADRLGVRIHTRFGDRFHGRAKHPALRIIRPLEPTLPLAIADISTIRIAPRPLRIKGLNAADTLETVSGDLFAARLISRELLLKTRSGLQLINLDNVHIVEIELSQEEPLAQVTFNGGDIQQGQLLTETVRVHSRYGDTLDIPVEKITRMGIRVNYRDNDSPRFNYRKQVPQAAWFQDRLRDGNMGPEMVALRGGAYTRGDSRGDDDESPPHTINLSPFAIAIYEITFEDYDRFAASTHREHPNDEDWGRGRRPVINVSWDDARAYVDWLSQQTGETYRLPTDAEWE